VDREQEALACLTAAIDAGAFPLDDEQDLRALLAALVVTFPDIVPCPGSRPISDPI